MIKPPKGRPGAGGYDAQRLAAELLDAINSGELHPGDRIPTTAALAEKCGVNKNTASKAVVPLKRIGVLSGPAGGKTWVRVPPLHGNRHKMMSSFR
ncbi:GntR family transcriptional regulator [Streptomyces sp. NPDC053427]|uniref:GntR family transcriptional regulator n=1 Tax=Streptomyces sp. NPDC053427 TaxID=3365701 RepID=UPI0037D62632